MARPYRLKYLKGFLDVTKDSLPNVSKDDDEVYKMYWDIQQEAISDLLTASPSDVSEELRKMRERVGRSEDRLKKLEAPRIPGPKKDQDKDAAGGKVDG